ncbi:MAG: YkvA family protein [Candidatus Dormibacter sp.]
MPGVLSRAKEVLFDVPRHGKLAYCLLRDDRVPAAPKAVLIGALGVIVSPIDFPAWIPVLGELDMLALGILAVETFILACPEDVRKEQEELVKAKQSVFDRDVRDTVGAARYGTGRVFNRISSSVRRRFAQRFNHEEYERLSEGLSN